MISSHYRKYSLFWIMGWLHHLLFFFLLVVVIIQLLLVFRFRHWPSVRKNRNEAHLPSVSVVVCSHNDVHELKKNLLLLLDQNYEIFEVIVVDDHSEDDTNEWLNTISSDKLRVLTLRNNKKPGKRWALAEGISAARHEWVVLTDADCMVPEHNWLKNIAGYFTEGYIGYVGYGPHKKNTGFFNKLIRFDTAHIASLYLSSAAAGFPYMGVGRNMGWHRSVVPLLVGALKQLPTASGDDDLVLQTMRNHGKILAIANPETFVYSEAKKTWSSWLRQKTRHHTTGWKYHWKDKLWLGAWHISRWIFYPLCFACIVLDYLPLIGISVFLLRSAFVWGWMAIRFNKLLEKDLILFVPLLEIIHTFVLPVFSLLSAGKKNKPWN